MEHRNVGMLLFEFDFSKILRHIVELLKKPVQITSSSNPTHEKVSQSKLGLAANDVLIFGNAHGLVRPFGMVVPKQRLRNRPRIKALLDVFHFAVLKGSRDLHLGHQPDEFGNGILGEPAGSVFAQPLHDPGDVGRVARNAFPKGTGGHTSTTVLSGDLYAVDVRLEKVVKPLKLVGNLGRRDIFSAPSESIADTVDKSCHGEGVGHMKITRSDHPSNSLSQPRRSIDSKSPIAIHESPFTTTSLLIFFSVAFGSL